jgi:hypothetical protein
VTTKHPAIDEVPSAPTLVIAKADKDGYPLVKCACGGVQGCKTCGGAGIMLAMPKCLGCGSWHGGGSNVQELRCLRLALLAARKVQFETDEAAAHRAYVAFGEAQAAHRSTKDRPVKFIDEWFYRGPRQPGIPEASREMWRAAIRAAARGS